MLGFGGAGVALQIVRRRVERSPGRFFAWMILLAVPFFLSGVAMAIPFSFLGLRPGPVYAASFAGSAAGALVALPFLMLAPTEWLLRLPLGLGAVACAFVMSNKGGGLRKGRGAALCAVLFLLVIPPADLKLSPYKDLAAVRKLPGAREIASRSGISGDYRAVFAPQVHSAPGLSIRFAGEIPPQVTLFADGEQCGIVPMGGGRTPPRISVISPPFSRTGFLNIRGSSNSASGGRKGC